MPTTPPTLVAEYETVWNGSTWPKVVNVTTAVGDRLVAKAMHAEFGGAGDVVQAPTGGTGLVWTLVNQINLALNSVTAMWTATAVTAEGPFALSFATAGSSPTGGVHVSRWSGSDGFGASTTVASGIATNGTGAPTTVITTTGANSVLEGCWADWNEVSGVTRTFLGSGTVTNPIRGGAGDLAYQDVGGAATFYAAAWLDTGVAGSKTVGIATPNTTKWTGLAVEVLGHTAASGVASVGRGHGAGYGVGAGTKRAAGTGVGSTPGVGVGAGTKRAGGSGVGGAPGAGVGAGAKRAAGAGVGNTPVVGMGASGAGAKTAAGTGVGSAPLVGVGASTKRGVGAGLLLAGLFGAGQGRKTARGAGVGVAAAVVVDRPALPVVGTMNLATRDAATAASANRAGATAGLANRTGPTMTGG